MAISFNHINDCTGAFIHTFDLVFSASFIERSSEGERAHKKDTNELLTIHVSWIFICLMAV